MNAERQREIETRIHQIAEELGLLEPADLTSWNPGSEHDLEEVEELYSEREALLQELKKDC